ncbi:MAG: hypothetical protein WBK28_04005 [Minisyncoccia bacterium]
MTREPLIHLALSLLFVAVCAGAYTFWFFASERVHDETAVVLTQIAEHELDQARTTSARAQIEELTTEEAFVRSYFVPEEDIVLFLEHLEEIGTGDNAEVSVASVTGSAKEGHISVSLSVEGTFNAVLKTIGHIEHGSYAVTTESLTFESEGEGRWRAVGVFLVGTTRIAMTP